MKKLFFLIAFATFFTVTSTAQQVEISAELRPRYENKQGYKSLLKPGEEGASFVSQRTRMNLNYKKENFKLKISLQNVRVWGDVGTLSSNDKSSNFHEAWAEFAPTDYLELKLGRQEIVYDDSRIFGNVGWAQQGRSHDAIIAKIKTSDNGKLDFGYALNNDSQSGISSVYSNAAGYKSFQYMWYHTTGSNFGLSVLALNTGVEYAGYNTENEISYSQTLGSRATYKSGDFSLNGAMYFQTGKMVSQSISSSYFSANANLKASSEFNIGVGFEYLSGKDMNDSSQDIKSFNPIFGTNHKFNGWMDYFYVGNHANSVGLIDLNATVSYKKDKITVKMVPHLFKSAGDMYDAGAKINNKLGTELDTTIGYEFSKDITFSAGYSQMFGTKSLEILKGGDSRNTNSWAWMMLTFKPSLFTSN